MYLMDFGLVSFHHFARRVFSQALR